MGITMMIQFFVPHPVSVGYYDLTTKWIRIVGAFALVLGTGSFIMFHSDKTRRRRQGWGYSIVAIAALVVVALIGLCPRIMLWWAVFLPTAAVVLGLLLVLVRSVDKLKRFITIWYVIAGAALLVALAGFAVGVLAGRFGWRLPHELAGGIRPGSILQNVIFTNFLVPLNASMFAILAFYMASAAYRAFRARTREAALLLVAAFIVMLGMVPIGANVPFFWFLVVAVAALAVAGLVTRAKALFIGAGMLAVGLLVWLVFWKFRIPPLMLPDTAEWVLSVPNMAAKRAIIFGVALGGIATSLKVILGIERGWLGGGKQ
jgi:hypothetical protein